jgi:hypothetical protein
MGRSMSHVPRAASAIAGEDGVARFAEISVVVRRRSSDSVDERIGLSMAHRTSMGSLTSIPQVVTHLWGAPLEAGRRSSFANWITQQPRQDRFSAK